ncbi:gp165 [Bacillus phage W.Ph.]|uniref:Gp165 n=1 Tax=Bacillus phage W.Ph. TaxID=764595 RepID=G9B1R6_9CAUD|nr:gp165 [Bacillus phage W.Ph.]ADH03311.1 gp165 [Bacillus phage W.Ph.]
MKKLLTLLVLCATLLIGCESDSYISTLEGVKVIDKQYEPSRARYSTITVEGKDVKLDIKVPDEVYRGIHTGTVITIKFDNRSLLAQHIKYEGEKKNEK